MRQLHLDLDRQVTAPSLMVALSSCPAAVAEQLAEALVHARLAACVQIVPQIRSVYRWQGEVQRGAEALLLIKLLPEQLVQAEALLRSLHPYEVPEWVVVPAIAVGHDYLSWAQQVPAT